MLLAHKLTIAIGNYSKNLPGLLPMIILFSSWISWQPWVVFHWWLMLFSPSFPSPLPPLFSLLSSLPPLSPLCLSSHLSSQTLRKYKQCQWQSPTKPEKCAWQYWLPACVTSLEKWKFSLFQPRSFSLFPYNTSLLLNYINLPIGHSQLIKQLQTCSRNKIRIHY